MKIFFCIHDRIEFDGNSYYSNPISHMVNRYADTKDKLTCYAPIVKVTKSKNERITREHINYINAPEVNELGKLINIKKYYRNLQMYLKQHDYAIIHIHASITSYLCVLACREILKPYITVVVGCAWDALWNHSIKGKFMAPICYILEKWIQNKADYSIYVTQKFLQSRYPTKGKWIACSNVELAFNKNLCLREIKSDNDTIHLATVAAVNVRYKGQQYVIQALSKLRSSNRRYKYHIIGSGDPSYLKDLAIKLNVADLVEFHGPIPHDEISYILDRTDIYIQPSKQEGLPRSVIEAMSRGCLCMGSNIAGIPELIDSKYLFKAGDSEQIATIIENISNEDIVNEGNLNIEKSKDYSKKVLDERRNLFIHNFRIETLL